MLAAYHESQGPPDVLRVGQLPDPDPPGPGQVLIRMEATSLDRVDIYWREGSHGMRLRWPRHVGGRDVAGRIAEVGDGVEGLAPGDRVMASTDRTHAELVVASAELTLPLPDRVTSIAAGATPTAGRSAHQALVSKADVQPGETVLVLAAGSGVGSFGVQIARALGATVIATASTADKRARAEELGASATLNHRADDLASQVLDVTDGRGVDVVLEHLGAPVFASCVDAMASNGRLVTCGVTVGHRADLHIGKLFVKGLHLMGVGRPSDAEIRVTLQDLLAMIAAGQVTPAVDTVYPLDEIADAHARMDDSAMFGKLVLVPDDHAGQGDR